MLAYYQGVPSRDKESSQTREETVRTAL